MPSFIKSNAVDKGIYCERVYAKYIADTCNFISSCEDIAEILSAKLPSGCYTNFRDALFHFRRMVKSTEENEIARQAFAVEEHANRAKTDAVASILEYCSRILRILSLEQFSLVSEAQEKLVFIQNTLDRYVLHLRLSGIMLEHTNILRPTDEEFENAVNSFFEFIKIDVGKENYYLACTKLSEQK